MQRMMDPVPDNDSLSVHNAPVPHATSKSPSLPAGYKPAVLHRPHPNSKLCENFHWVPYPLGLMPYDSWHRLHHRDDAQPPLPYRCPVCKAERKVVAHLRKAFLVAERLSWDDKIVSVHDKDLNEELNWKVNYELGILDPSVEDPEQILGGKHSRANKCYPYKNEREMKLALKLIFMTEDITETTWALWIGTQLDMQKAMDSDPDAGISATAVARSSQWTPRDVVPRNASELIETIDLTSSPDIALDLTTGQSHGLPTPPSSLPKATENLSEVPTYHGAFSSAASRATPTTKSPLVPALPQRIESYKTLQDFYTLLDKIERSSYVGALFLEAYAEKLRDDMCKSCWFKQNINLDLF